MSKNQNDHKLRVNPFRIIMIFSILFLVMEAIFYVSFQFENFWPFETSFYIYTPILLISSGIFCYISITSTFYEIDKHRLVHSKMGKVSEYQWKDIVFLDEEWSIRHKMMRFFTSDGRERYLVFDKEAKIFDYTLKYARLMSEEEFRARFPKAKL